MPPTKNSEQDHLVAHTKAIEALRKAVESQTSKAEALLELQEEKLKEWADREAAAALDFKNKSAERDSSAKRKAEDMENNYQTQRIRLTMEVKEHGIETAKSVLGEEGYETIKKTHLADLRDECAQLKSNIKTIEDSTVKRITERLNEKHDMAKTTAELEHSKKLAEMSAVNKQQDKEIQNLTAQANDLRSDITKQQDLLGKAFESMSKSSTTVVEKRA
jgi:hypothetical protein